MNTILIKRVYRNLYPDNDKLLLMLSLLALDKPEYCPHVSAIMATACGCQDRYDNYEAKHDKIVDMMLEKILELINSLPEN